MKDYVRVKKPGQKAVKMTKYILLLTLKECYAEFSKLYPEEKISFSSFANLRCTSTCISTCTSTFTPTSTSTCTFNWSVAWNY